MQRDVYKSITGVNIIIIFKKFYKIVLQGQGFQLLNNSPIPVMHVPYTEKNGKLETLNIAIHK